jgi:hypothetical protein
MNGLAVIVPRRKPFAHVVCALAALCLPALTASPARAQASPKADPKASPESDSSAHLFTFPAKIKLSDSQKAKLAELKKEYRPKLTSNHLRYLQIVTNERRLASEEARTAAAAKGKEGKELNDLALAAMHLSPEEKSALQDIDEQRQQLVSEINDRKMALLTPDQREALAAKPDFWLEFAQKLFQPLLLFFYLGFLIPLLKVPYRFPKQVYQGITLYLLVAIGWHGGEELAKMSGSGFQEALGFVVIGFCANIVISIIAYNMLRRMTRMRTIDCATVGGYYGSDSAGTFLTCVGVLMVMGYREFGYMPVLLAVMETPGCLVCLYQIARLRRNGMDAHGNMPWEAGYSTEAPAGTATALEEEEELSEHGEAQAAGSAGGRAVAVHKTTHTATAAPAPEESNGHGGNGSGGQGGPGGFLNWKIFHEVFFNPGLYFLFGGIIIGLVAGKLFIPFGKEKVIASENLLFVTLMHGVLCLFLLEMGITACERLRDLKSAGAGFIVFGILAPNLFAVFGIVLAHLYSMALGHPFTIPQYALFAVLCGAASYIAVPAVQRMAIPEASPTLPLAASLGLTFTWNVTLGIPIYISIAQFLTRSFPVG